MDFGKLGKMAEMMKQAKLIQDEIKKARYEGEAGGVKAVVNGEMDIIDLRIPPELPTQRIESAVKEAVNKTLRAAKQDMAGKMSKLTGGLKLPGI